MLVSIKGEDFFTDFLVAAPNDTNANGTAQLVGEVAEQGTKRKLKAVLSHCDVPPTLPTSDRPIRYGDVRVYGN